MKATTFFFVVAILVGTGKTIGNHVATSASWSGSPAARDALLFIWALTTLAVAVLTWIASRRRHVR